MIRATKALVHRSLLGGIAFGEDGLLVLFWWCLVYCYKELIIVADLFFLNYYFFFWVGASTLPLGHCVVAEVGVIGMFEILIYALYQKKMIDPCFGLPFLFSNYH
jgi:hypothetical protein